MVKSEKEPKLKSAKIITNTITEGRDRSYELKSLKVGKDDKRNRTEVSARMESSIPIYEINIEVSDTIDFYRPITVQYLVDSVRSKDAWKYKYRTLATGTLSSLEENRFQFSSTILNGIRILIHDGDNEPLTVKSIVLKGYIHELVGRFPEAASYYLLYGKKHTSAPSYDIDHFADQIPTDPQQLELGTLKRKPKQIVVDQKPLFENKLWLWAIMGTIVLLLGWFSLRMMKEK